jgi:hypothetical protein
MPDGVEIGRLSDEENRRTAWAHEREAPLGRGRRMRQRFRDGDAERIALLLLRRSASSNVTDRSGNATAIGIPGAPPPEPTSITGPSNRSTSGTARRESSSRTRRASASESAVSPGVATTA